MAGGGTEPSVREFQDSKLGEVSTELKLKTTAPSSSSFIFRAHPGLRRVNEGAFEPQIISIGPYHHRKDHLKAMEKHKVRYLNILLQRLPVGLESYVEAYKSIEEEVRSCYANYHALNSSEFERVMILDGLFVVELISKFMDHDLIESDDALFKQNLNLSLVALDLLLLENQLPLCLLEKFAHMTGLIDDTFARQALNFFSETNLLLRMLYKKRDEFIQNTEHLLGLVHDNWNYFPSGYLQTSHLITLEQEDRKHPVPVENHRHRQRLGYGECYFIRSATELSERGIKFLEGEENFLFDIQFKHGALFIPTLIVDHDTERMMRNLIAYEQFNDKSGSIVMDYARFIDCLINYPADVALLCDCGVIDNRLGSNEDVASMINKINNYVYLSTGRFSYSDIFYEVNKHCRQPWNLWKVKLRQTYFNTPWDWVLTSIAAATLLLVLTLLQTIFSVLAYFKKTS